MAAILTTERMTGRRIRIAQRRSPRPTCARPVSGPASAQVRGPVALAAASRVVETPAETLRTGDARAVASHSPRVRASAATFRRRRLFALLGLVGALAVVGQAGAALGGPSLGSASHVATVHRYVVRAGDSLWGAAARLAPNDDPRAVVDALVHARGNGPLMPGEVLRWQG